MAGDVQSSAFARVRRDEADVRHNGSIRRILALLPLVTVALTAGADDLLGPAEYLKILTESKLRYNLLGGPSKTPVDEMRCPRRDETTRVKVEGNEKTLVAWTIKPEAKKLLEEGETLYQANDLPGAAEKYKAALATDQQAVSGYYFYGDTLLFGEKDAAAALAQYEKGIALDPTMPSGHFFASTALVHLGRPDDAREQIIKALTYHPSYETVWKIAEQNYSRWNIRPVVRYKFEPPAGYLGVRGANGADIYGGAGGEWLGYATCKAVWASEAKFRKRHSADGWSLEEERACVLNQLMSRYNQTEAKLVEEQKTSGVASPAVKEDETIAALAPLDRHLFDVAKEHLLDGYILFEIIGQHCPISLSLMDDALIKQVDGYIRKYVIVAR